MVALFFTERLPFDRNGNDRGPDYPIGGEGVVRDLSKVYTKPTLIMGLNLDIYPNF